MVGFPHLPRTFRASGRESLTAATAALSCRADTPRCQIEPWFAKGQLAILALARPWRRLVGCRFRLDNDLRCTGPPSGRYIDLSSPSAPEATRSSYHLARRTAGRECANERNARGHR